MLKSFDELIARATSGKAKRIAIAGAGSGAVLKAAGQAAEKSIAEPVLIGSGDDIRQSAEQEGIDIGRFELREAGDDTEAAHTACSMTDSGDTDAIMKGSVSTATLLKAVLDRKYSLRTGSLLSHAALLQLPSYHKFLIITDGGMVIRPTVEQKADIIRNAVSMAGALGIANPKVAVLAALEKVNPDMPETKDAAVLTEMAADGELGSVILEGPLAIDGALSARAAEIKGIDSQIAGDPDILIVPDIASGNIFAKGLIYLAGARIGGLVLGAAKPVILLSRADDAETKMNSMALGAVAS